MSVDIKNWLSNSYKEVFFYGCDWGWIQSEIIFEYEYLVFIDNMEVFFKLSV